MGTKWITGDIITFARMNQKTLIVLAAQPAIMYAGMLWLDTDDDTLYERNAANAAWTTVMKVGDAPTAHVLATTGPHTDTLPLTDLAVGVQGNVIIRGAADWEALAVGTAGQMLRTGGAGASPTWVWATELDNAPDATDTGNGITTKDVVGEIVIAGDVLYMKADGKYWKADADAAATMPAVVMAMAGGAADATVELLHMGYYREDSRWNWTVGNGAANLLYVHTTAGDIVQLANKPAGSGDQLQVVGYVVTADIVFFNPSLVLAEIV